MEMNHVLLSLVGITGCALLLATLMREIQLPAAIAYIVTGVLVGPTGLGLVSDRELLTHMGELGVIMLMFFIGMEVSLPRLIAGWRIAVLGTAAQIIVSVLVCMLVATLFDWPWRTGVLFGFIVSMSSTAVVLTMLKDSGELEHPFGQNALGVLLMQDMAIVPMMIVIGLMGGGAEGDAGSGMGTAIQLVGGAALVAAAVWLMRTPGWSIPDWLKRGVERRVMLGLLLCFAAASLTSLLGLSAPFGAFLAGMLLHASDQADWVEEHLRSLYIVFVAIFFLSVGMLVDARFVIEHWPLMLGLTVAVLVLNSGINSLVLRALGESWPVALLTGGVLGQIGEFSFLMASMGLSLGLMDDTLHRITMAVIALSLMLSPLWMMGIKSLIRRGLIES
ncbi:MAG: cation/H(+) antiporter [Zetaproteobacteria bacterium CG12_big_fil_rev_8_21_14_0_65_55_1124]|nr:MAG: cation/H(+) antiporter [Zetaproteobacteria bacterium CG1_02_55_237]PIS18333.1 MAG: cation/H(+) antiporter [Zetaproteobacteria bacterium CG08_land_8_20_14_0_20_55_17]PIW43074.1 MAG: cation/H(+) antiporter [Zetaproteobacteria bacterium CG12_big_fil_rev_8_21_14_0_65_55_1124]PIY52273.1 MAG: cation/H(+) antiporter [Zetaproteobacteria bacterium CG_4_10_14_0_8_um_filter_55_43]PIZ38765.1 MAG: cation/H(+) antiporter [Zetaproteobacteria bacterium CG_4_10_14_0_2_um_filter_55_20]PJB82033.1 MAG: ca